MTEPPREPPPVVLQHGDDGLRPGARLGGPHRSASDGVPLSRSEPTQYECPVLMFCVSIDQLQRSPLSRRLGVLVPGLPLVVRDVVVGEVVGYNLPLEEGLVVAHIVVFDE